VNTVLSFMPKRIQTPNIPSSYEGLEGEGRVIPSETGPASHRALFLPQRPFEVSRGDLGALRESGQESHVLDDLP
jgi:hypothetical protein